MEPHDVVYQIRVELDAMSGYKRGSLPIIPPIRDQVSAARTVIEPDPLLQGLHPTTTTY